jgi:hypothetical protein
VDVRGEGGYVLAPPSIHPSGLAYAWSVDSASAFADAPDWLVRIDPIAYAYQNRPQLVVDILKLLKGYHNAGRPSRPPELQSFAHWSNTVRGCICWLAETYPDAKLADPCKTMEAVRENDPVLDHMRAVVAAWRNQFGDGPKTAAEAVKTAEATKFESVEVEVPYATETTPKTYKPDRAFRNPELRDALLTVAGGKIDIGVFGQLDQEARRTRGRYGRRPLLHDRKRTDVRRQRQVESRRDEIKMKWV